MPDPEEPADMKHSVKYRLMVFAAAMSFAAGGAQAGHTVTTHHNVADPLCHEMVHNAKLVCAREGKESQACKEEKKRVHAQCGHGHVTHGASGGGTPNKGTDEEKQE